MLVLALQSHKMGGHVRVLRDRRNNTLDACQCKRVVFSWQAQHFVTLRRWSQKSWQGQHFVMCLKNDESIAKVILFHVCKDGFIRKTRRKSSIFTFKV